MQPEAADWRLGRLQHIGQGTDSAAQTAARCTGNPIEVPRPTPSRQRTLRRQLAEYPAHANGQSIAMPQQRDEVFRGTTQGKVASRSGISWVGIQNSPLAPYKRCVACSAMTAQQNQPSRMANSYCPPESARDP